MVAKKRRRKEMSEIERLGEILDENYIEDKICMYDSSIKKIEDGKD